MTNTTTQPAQKKNENPLVSLFFNILLPVLILNNLSERLGEGGPKIALVVALAFPLGYGLWDYYRQRKTNWISILGLVNILFTGGLALYKLEGMWFAVKEAAFPLAIGLIVYFSAYTRAPLVRAMIYNDKVINIPRVDERLHQNLKHSEFDRHLARSTQLLAGSFFLSALLNFLLARYIFVEIDPQLTTLERETILNKQISQMTWLGMVVITVPCMIFMFGILWHLLHGIRKYTGLSLDEIFINAPTKAPERQSDLSSSEATQEPPSSGKDVSDTV